MPLKEKETIRRKRLPLTPGPRTVDEMGQARRRNRRNVVFTIVGILAAVFLASLFVITVAWLFSR